MAAHDSKFCVLCLSGEHKKRIPKAVLKRAALYNLYETWDESYGHNFETNFVPGKGNVNARVVFVGEAPGANEDKNGEPFVGAAGKVLDKLLKIAGLRREDIFITNLLKWRPPKNRDPLKDEIPANMAFLRMELNIIDPDVVVTLGRFAAMLYFPDPHMGSIAGTMHVKDGRVVVPFYHPAVALYDRSTMKDMEKHVLTVKDALKGALRGEGRRVRRTGR